MMHGWGWYGTGPFGFFGYGIFSFIIGFVFMILFFVLIYFLFKNLIKTHPRESNSKSNENEYEILKILNEKLAKGEISEEEYLRKKELIKKN